MDNKYIKIIKGTPLFQGMSDEEITQFLRLDEKAVEENKKRLGKPVFHGCPGSMMKTFAKKPAPVDTPSK